MTQPDVPNQVAEGLAAAGFDPEQIGVVMHQIHTAQNATVGDPLKTVVIGDDGMIYVRVAYPDALGPIHKWKIIDPQHGDVDAYNAEPTVKGTKVYTPETADE